MNLEQAKLLSHGLVGEKLREDVRVVSMGEFFHGTVARTHVVSTGDIGCLKILSKAGIAEA